MALSQHVGTFMPVRAASSLAARECCRCSRAKVVLLTGSSATLGPASQESFGLRLAEEVQSRSEYVRVHSSLTPTSSGSDEYPGPDLISADVGLSQEPLFRSSALPSRGPGFQGQDSGSFGIWTPNGSEGSRRLNQTTVDRWPPSLGKDVEEEDVNGILDRLKGVAGTEAGVAKALEGWEKHLSSRTLVAILKVLEGWEKPLAFFSWVKTKQFCEVTVFTYNVVLRNLREGLQMDLVEKLVEEMFAKGIQPDNYTYSTVISCANSSRQSERAIKWYEKMYERGCVPDEITHSAMMDAYSKQGRLTEAVKIYESLRGRGWRPDKVTYGMVVSTLGRAGRNLEAYHMYQEMLRDGIQPSVNLQNYMVRVLVKIGKLGPAKEAFDKILQSGNVPSELTLTSIVDACGKAQEYEEVLKLYKRARAESWPLDIVNYQCVIKHCSEAYFVTEGTKVFNDMMAIYRPTAWTYKTMIHLYAKTSRMKEAMEMYSLLMGAGNEPDIVCYTCLIQGFGNAGEYLKMEEVFQKMLEGGLQFDEKFVGSVLAVLGACQTDEQRRVCCRILEKSDENMYNIVQKVCAEHLETEELQGAVNAIIRGYSQAAQQRYFNSLADLCKRLEHRDRGRQMMRFAFIAGAYPGLQVRFASLWSLRLSALSVAAAEFALEWWVDVLQASFSQGLYLPLKFRIELLSPKMEKAAALEGSTLHVEKLEVVRSILEECKAPFEQSKGDGIWFETTLDDVRPWLWFRETASEDDQDTTGMVTAQFKDTVKGDPTEVAPEADERVPANFS